MTQMLGGFALACLFLNTSAAIVVYVIYKYVMPVLFALGLLVVWFKHLAPWMDFQSAQNELFNVPMTGSQWAHLAVNGIIWLVIPRDRAMADPTRRGEVKATPAHRHVSGFASTGAIGIPHARPPSARLSARCPLCWGAVASTGPFMS